MKSRYIIGLQPKARQWAKQVQAIKREEMEMPKLTQSAAIELALREVIERHGAKAEK